MDMRVKDVDGNILTEESEVKNSWSRYFQDNRRKAG